MKRPYIIITSDTPKELVIPTLEKLGGVNKYHDSNSFKEDQVLYIDCEEGNLILIDYTETIKDDKNYYQLDSITLEPIETNPTEIELLKNRVKELEECLSSLVDYDKKYPTGKIYSYSAADKMCAELDKVIEQAKQLLNK